ncbi:MAG TPA: hypothetical protein VG937_17345 [Polyangiaceae bacterium]|nr:hypothetical protein [Polyangiaceae bacterium]
MRSLRIWTDIVEWRWTPTVGLALGAVSYVSLALLIIPDRIGDDERNASRVGTFQALRNRTSAFAASIAPSLTDSEPPRAESGAEPAPSPPTPAAQPHPTDESNFPRRGFSPPLERAEPPPPTPTPTPEPVVVPPPAPPPPEPPAAAPASPQPEPSPPPPPTVPPDGQTTPTAQPQPQSPTNGTLPEAPPGQAPPPAPIPPH